MAQPDAHVGRDVPDGALFLLYGKVGETEVVLPAGGSGEQGPPKDLSPLSRIRRMPKCMSTASSLGIAPQTSD